MNTQTFAQTQDFTAITDDELIAVNGGWIGMIRMVPQIARVLPKIAKVGARGAMIADPLIEMANG